LQVFRWLALQAEHITDGQAALEMHRYAEIRDIHDSAEGSEKNLTFGSTQD
jgi:hypothetical protein